MEMVDPFGWHELDADQIKEVHARLSEFERTTWREILAPTTGSIICQLDKYVGMLKADSPPLNSMS
jgi:hypothetical protein